MNTKKWYGAKDLEKRFGRMTLGMFISSFRESEELSQTEYAKKLGLSRANLCDLEKGRKLISPERAAKIAKKMGVPEKVLIQLAIQDSLHDAKLKYTVELKAAS
jgi:transcriptional regulator with XRE-family HTH domain